MRCPMPEHPARPPSAPSRFLAPEVRPGDLAPEVRPGDLAPEARQGPLAPEARRGDLAPEVRPGPLAPEARSGDRLPEAGAAAGALPARLVYVSRATPGLGRAELFRIIRTAHVRNRAEGITGALLLLDGWFAQLLEGPPVALEACLARLRADRRHAGLALRLRGRGLARLFPGQAMALRTRACLGEGLLERLGYRPGFPAEAMPADALVEFVVAACHARGKGGGPGRTPPATGPAGRGEASARKLDPALDAALDGVLDKRHGAS
jgi:hypothetical protein